MDEKKTTVLIVDDSTYMRNVLRSIVTTSGFEVCGEAVNGIEAIDKFQELAPDIVTLDITMPEMDGIEALTKIIELNPKAKVIMCSAMGAQGIIMKAMQIGASDYITKPFQPNRVIEAIRNTLYSNSLN